jgi:hypothetical protein
MTLPGFTAESALSAIDRRYLMPQKPRGRRIAAASGVQLALINQGGGGSNFWCSDDGTCTCEGGSLSSDCWNMKQYCIDDLSCRISPPYLCYCHWTFMGPPRSIFTRPSGGISMRSRAGF